MTAGCGGKGNSGKAVNSRRRLLLGIALLLAAADGIWWASRAHRGERQEYELGATQLGVEVADYAALPLFDEARGAWLRDGKPATTKDLPYSWQDISPGAAPNAGLPFVLVRLPDNAGQTTFRHALLALVKGGRCAAGIATGVANRPGGSENVPVHRLVWVRDDAGAVQTCRSR